MSKDCISPLIDGCLLDCIDDALAIRDEIGAYKSKVYITKRSWSGNIIGEGTPTDVDTQIYPTPEIVEYKHDIRLKDGGSIRNGDIALKSVSRKRYTEDDMALKSNDPSVELFFKICGKLYESISVKRGHATMDVMVRRLSSQDTHTGESQANDNSQPVGGPDVIA